MPVRVGLYNEAPDPTIAPCFSLWWTHGAPGVLVEYIADDSPAVSLLRLGDALLAINGRTVTNSAAAARLIPLAAA